MKNIIQTQLDAATRVAVEKAINDLEAALAGKTATLTEDERRRYGSINEQNKLIVNKARDYRQSQPNLSSPDVNWDEFEDDYQSRVFIKNSVNRLMAVVHDLGSTKISFLTICSNVATRRRAFRSEDSKSFRQKKASFEIGARTQRRRNFNSLLAGNPKIYSPRRA